MGDKKIKTCYIDDIIETQLSRFLRNYPGIHNKDILVNKNDTLDSILNKVIDNDFRIVIIDSDFNNGGNLTMTTGQQVELFLTKKYPFIFVIVITSHSENGYENFFKKFNSRESRMTKESSNQYYDRTLKPIIDFAIEKYYRNVVSIKTELTKEKEIDEFQKKDIEDAVNNEERINVSKKDLDRLFELFDEIKNAHDNK